MRPAAAGERVQHWPGRAGLAPVQARRAGQSSNSPMQAIVGPRHAGKPSGSTHIRSGLRSTHCRARAARRCWCCGTPRTAAGPPQAFCAREGPRTAPDPRGYELKSRTVTESDAGPDGPAEYLRAQMPGRRCLHCPQICHLCTCSNWLPRLVRDGHVFKGEVGSGGHFSVGIRAARARVGCRPVRSRAVRRVGSMGNSGAQRIARSVTGWSADGGTFCWRSASAWRCYGEAPGLSMTAGRRAA